MAAGPKKKSKMATSTQFNGEAKQNGGRKKIKPQNGHRNARGETVAIPEGSEWPYRVPGLIPKPPLSIFPEAMILLPRGAALLISSLSLAPRFVACGPKPRDAN